MLNAIRQRVGLKPQSVAGNTAAGNSAAKLRVGMLGGRGLDSSYGGVENAVRQIAQHMVNSHPVDLTVYGTDASECNSDVTRQSELSAVYAPHWVYRKLGQHGAVLAGVLHALFKSRPKVMIVFASGPNVFVPVLRLFGIRVVSSLRAIDSARDKWGFVSRTILRLGEFFAWRFANVFTANSEEIIAALQTKRPDALFIPNGSIAAVSEPDQFLSELGLRPKGYFLFAARFDPVKRLHLLLEAHANLPKAVQLPLVVAGGHSKSSSYFDELKAYESERVLFVGHLGPERLDPLMAHCRAFVLPSVLEGMSNSLLSAMASGRAVLASDIRPNADVLLNPDALFIADDTESLYAGLYRLATDLPFANDLGAELKLHAQAKYSWQSSADLFYSAAESALARRPRNA